MLHLLPAVRSMQGVKKNYKGRRHGRFAYELGPMVGQGLALSPQVQQKRDALTSYSAGRAGCHRDPHGEGRGWQTWVHLLPATPNGPGVSRIRMVRGRGSEGTVRLLPSMPNRPDVSVICAAAVGMAEGRSTYFLQRRIGRMSAGSVRRKGEREGRSTYHLQCRTDRQRGPHGGSWP